MALVLATSANYRGRPFLDVLLCGEMEHTDHGWQPSRYVLFGNGR